MYDAVGLVSSEPKNASRRTVDLLQKVCSRRFALEALRSHRKRQMDQPTVGAQWTDNGLVFTTIGTPLEAQKIVNRHFKPLLRRTGLPNIRWHDLRHTCVTLLLGRGVHPKMVQHLIGHDSI
jgi:integrase